MHNLSDAALVKKAKENYQTPQIFRQAIGILYDRHHEKIFRYLLVRVYDIHQAEDLTGEVFERLMNAIPNYQDRSVPFEAWLYRIARNLMIDNYRKQKTRKSIPLQAIENIHLEGTNPEDQVDKYLALGTVIEALDKIEASQREVIELRFLMGIPAKDVALILDKTTSAVKGLQRRGLNKLRTILDGHKRGSNE